MRKRREDKSESVESHLKSLSHLQLRFDSVRPAQGGDGGDGGDLIFTGEANNHRVRRLPALFL